LVAVASSSIRLPYLNQCIRDGLVIPAGDLAVNQDALADGFATVDQSHVIIDTTQVLFTEYCAGDITEALIESDEVIAWVALNRGAVFRECTGCPHVTDSNVGQRCHWF